MAFQCSPDHPVREVSTPAGSSIGRTGRSSTRRTRRRSTRTSTRSTSSAQDWQALWNELRRVLLFWVARGVKVFRVDNPHTKPFPFWEWVIAEVKRRRPGRAVPGRGVHAAEGDVPAGEAGVHAELHLLRLAQRPGQSIMEYFTTLTTPPVVDFMRPNPWPNTPDILAGVPADRRPGGVHRACRVGGNVIGQLRLVRPGVRADGRPTRAARQSEEYLDSEKYQIRQWDRGRADSLVGSAEPG